MAPRSLCFFGVTLKVVDVSNEDGIHLACLIKAIGVATFPSISGKDIDAVYSAKRWLFDLAGKVAAGLPTASSKASSGSAALPASPQKASAVPSSTQGMKIKAMGPIGSPSKKKRK